MDHKQASDYKISKNLYTTISFASKLIYGYPRWIVCHAHERGYYVISRERYPLLDYDEIPAGTYRS